MSDIKAVDHVEEIRHVKTMADGSFNITLNLPEYCADQAAWYMKNTRKMARTVTELIDENMDD